MTHSTMKSLIAGVAFKRLHYPLDVISIRGRWCVADQLRLHKLPGSRNRRTDETCIKVKSDWNNLYRAVDNAGNTVDFLLRAKRDDLAARRYFEKVIDQNRIGDDRQDRRQSRRAAGEQYRTRGADYGPPGKVPEQHCPTGPPGY
jgi:hypothetical protein